MQTPITYFIDQVNGTADLALGDGRFVAKTQGKGVIDKMRVIDISIADLKHFCLVPTTAPQNLQTPGIDGDYSYDSEFIFSYQEAERLKKKRVFINSEDESFRTLLEHLATECPGASLLHLDPAEAQKQMGVMSAARTISILIGLLVGLPILIGLVFIVLKILET